jgi:hypothetical protein
MTILINKKIEVKDFASVYYGYTGCIIENYGDEIIVDFWPELNIKDSFRKLKRDQIRFLDEI